MFSYVIREASHHAKEGALRTQQNYLDWDVMTYETVNIDEARSSKTIRASDFLV